MDGGCLLARHAMSGRQCYVPCKDGCACARVFCKHVRECLKGAMLCMRWACAPPCSAVPRGGDVMQCRCSRFKEWPDYQCPSDCTVK